MEFFPGLSDSDEDEPSAAPPSRPSCAPPKKRKYQPEKSNGSPPKMIPTIMISAQAQPHSPKKKSTKLPKKRKNSESEAASEDDVKPVFNASVAKKRFVAQQQADNFTSSDDDRKPIARVKYTSTSSSASNLEDSDSSAFSPQPTTTSMPSIHDPMPIIQIAGTKKKPVYSNIAQKLMAQMGYEDGKGLGSKNQGRQGIIELSTQKGRRGLGLTLPGLQPDRNVEWDPATDKISVFAEFNWMPETHLKPPVIKELRLWQKVGKKKLTIDDEVEFCDPKILQDVLSCKSVFDKLNPEELRNSRLRSNPFETIRGVFFQNRAAMKMAEIDANFDFMFTNPKDEKNEPLVKPENLLYFADICAGPGGFSEYVLWRKKWHTKGFGLTLKEMNDFKLDQFLAASPETFEPHYGLNGLHGDGDIYKEENLKEFRKHILENTTDFKSVEGAETGVHFVMADGGFSVEGKENIQEILSKRLYLCQFLCALSILRTDGHFVCKLFDLFTSFSVGLVYLLYRSFKQVCIYKPNTSRPANSERYVVCKWKRENVKDVHDYMFEVNCSFGSLEKGEDIVEIVPIEILREDTAFYQYIVDSNNDLGQRQVVSLEKIRIFAKNSELHELRQSDLRKECLEIWKIPDKMRSAPSRCDPEAKFQELLKGQSTQFITGNKEFPEMELKKIESIYNYRLAVSGVEKNKPEKCFILSLGWQHIFKWSGKSWIKLTDLTFELPAGTLFFAEIVAELKGEGRAQKKIFALHIVDVLYIGGENMSDINFNDRIKQAAKLVKAISKPTRQDLVPVKVKEIFKMEDINQIFERLEMKMCKRSQNNYRLCYKMKDGRHFLPTGMYFIKIIEEPYSLEISKSSRRWYYYNKSTKKSDYNCPKGSISPFSSSFASLQFWSWEEGVKLLDHHEAKQGKIHRHTIASFVNQKLAN